MVIEQVCNHLYCELVQPHGKPAWLDGVGVLDNVGETGCQPWIAVFVNHDNLRLAKQTVQALCTAQGIYEGYRVTYRIDVFHKKSAQPTQPEDGSG